MKTMLIATVAALMLGTGFAQAASLHAGPDPLVATVSGQAEAGSVNAAPAGFYRGTAAYEAAASIARYVATHQGKPAPSVMGFVQMPSLDQQGNG
ncbi:MAG: hypothetical protein KGL12_07900 [Rhodospirillales bacterium]|nr:hypothetical protein [Rhodospirillales bacterium]